MNNIFQQKKLLAFIAAIFVYSQFIIAQNGVRISRIPGPADASAMLDVVADGNPGWKGLLIPRMTAAQRTGISSPAEALLVYQTDGSAGFYYWDGTAWLQWSAGALGGTGTTNYLARWTGPTTLGIGAAFDNGSNVGIGTGTPNASAVLDVNASNKGLLAPQVSLISVTDVSTIVSPATSLLVYNTNASITNGNGVGYYFYNGTRWEKIVNSKTNFTIWGINTCPANTSTIVYPGWAASGHYNHSGSGSNMLCLTNAPSWTGASYNDASVDASLIYGTEYEPSGYGIAALNSVHDYDAVCAVCVADNASVTMMLPGTVICPSGWTQQYWGYIMASEYNTQRKSEFVCVYNTPTASGTNANSNGALWYPTETEMGALIAASGYVQDREVTCSVCTK